jgi:hypothetical protein
MGFHTPTGRRRPYGSSGKKFIASQTVSPSTHARFTARYISSGLTKPEVMLALIELYAEGVLDELVTRRVEARRAGIRGKAPEKRLEE